jgi:putative serine protease PepD
VAVSVPPTPPPTTPETSESRRSSGRAWLVLAALIVALALVTAGYLIGEVSGHRSSGSPDVESTSASTTDSSQRGPTTPTVHEASNEPVVAVAAALSPAVVQIQTAQGLGSGIIYDASGLIVTNSHVVGTATQVKVTLSDGVSMEGRVVGSDPSSDIAVVRIDPAGRKLTAAKLATGEPAVGSVTVAIGSPFGLSGTVTSGVVSAVDRPLANAADVTIEMIQTDAAINPGNSGGALADINGEVIGVNSEILSEGGGNNGIGFAIPIATAMSVADKITSGQSLARPVVGVEVEGDPSGAAGAYVAKVTAGGPAAKAGIRVGDVIIGIDGRAVSTPGAFVDQVVTHAPGQRSTLDVRRGTSMITVTVTYAAG